MLALASPASLKGVLSAADAAAALARGFRRAGAEAEELPLADGGEGTAEVLGAKVVRIEQVHDAFGRPRVQTAWLSGRGVPKRAAYSRYPRISGSSSLSTG